MRLEAPAPFLPHLTGKRQSFPGERRRKLQTHHTGRAQSGFRWTFTLFVFLQWCFDAAPKPFSVQYELFVRQVSADDLDALVIPGGFAPDYMRRRWPPA
jgi:hypothetical protein